MLIGGLYAALLALLGLILAARVSLRRRSTRVGIGNGGDAELARRSRAFGNFIEYVPLALLLLLLLELGHARPVLLHAFGVALLLGRLLHAFGLSREAGVSFGRGVGILLTWLAVFGMALSLLWMQAALWLTAG